MCGVAVLRRDHKGGLPGRDQPGGLAARRSGCWHGWDSCCKWKPPDGRALGPYPAACQFTPLVHGDAIRAVLGSTDAQARACHSRLLPDRKCEACPACRVCKACSRAVHGLTLLQKLHPVTYMHPCGLSARPSVRNAEHLPGLMSTCQIAEHYPHPASTRNTHCRSCATSSVALQCSAVWPSKCPAESRRSRAGAMRGSLWQAALGLTWRSCPALFQYGTPKCRQGLAWCAFLTLSHPVHVP